MKQYPKGILVMNYLQGLGMNYLTIGQVMDDSKLEQSYQLIQANPKISKEEFLIKMGIKELKD